MIFASQDTARTSWEDDQSLGFALLEKQLHPVELGTMFLGSFFRQSLGSRPQHRLLQAGEGRNAPCCYPPTRGDKVMPAGIADDAGGMTA